MKVACLHLSPSPAFVPPASSQVANYRRDAQHPHAHYFCSCDATCMPLHSPRLTKKKKESSVYLITPRVFPLAMSKSRRQCHLSVTECMSLTLFRRRYGWAAAQRAITFDGRVDRITLAYSSVVHVETAP